MRPAQLLLASALLACSAGSTQPQRGQESVQAVRTPSPAASAASETHGSPSENAVVLVTEPEALDVVERGPGGFARMVDPAAYQVIVRALVADLDRVQRSDKLSGTSVARHAHRLLDRRWLASKDARFELVAITSRLDRQPFHDSACGEVRLVYRLSYQSELEGQTLSSRLPIALAVELLGEAADAGSCQAAAARWIAPEGLDGRKLGEWLIDSAGPLAPERLVPGRIARINVNLQSVRWPSTVRPDLGGHAEYTLRSFVPEQGGLKIGRLENTPDVTRLRRLPAERRALLAWLRQPEQLAALDRGLLRVPDQYLASEAVSVTPHGLGRRANRPFRKLLSSRDFAGLDLESYTTIRSPEALIRRLDALSCPGCHQSRSLAGFHVLGSDREGVAAGNSVLTEISPHLYDELRRRWFLTRRLARGLAVDFSAPFAERAKTSAGDYGEHCGLGDPGFSDWQCAEGLSCQAHGTAHGEPAQVGVCLPPQAGVGDPCETSELTQTDDAHRDRNANPQVLSCAASAATCNKSSVGFPGGMCTASCDKLPADGACGAIAVLTSFNDCLARNQPFSSCIADNSSPAGLRACNLTRPCRDDYLCARAPIGDGVCIPPYFLFQLRVDGHPSPR